MDIDVDTGTGTVTVADTDDDTETDIDTRTEVDTSDEMPPDAGDAISTEMESDTETGTDSVTEIESDTGATTESDSFIEDFCSPNPCQNGGSCINGTETYSCSCINGWTGNQCQICDRPSSGTEICDDIWGLNDNGQLGLGPSDPANHSSPAGPIDGLTAATINVVELALGGFHTCALLSNDDVFCWGSNGYGQLGNENMIEVN